MRGKHGSAGHCSGQAGQVAQDHWARSVRANMLLRWEEARRVVRSRFGPDQDKEKEQARRLKPSVVQSHLACRATHRQPKRAAVMKHLTLPETCPGPLVSVTQTRVCLYAAIDQRLN